MRALLLVSLGLSLWAAPSSAHPGGLNAQGCHNNRKTGDYHCHRGGGSSAPAQKRTPGSSGGGTYFANCSAARAVGAAPVRASAPGYSRKLDRDGDGVGCE